MTGTEKVFAAIESCDLAALQEALRRPVDLTAPNREGQTALHAWVDAGWRADDRFLETLLHAGADINQPDSEGRTPLDRAMHAPAATYYGTKQIYRPFTDKVTALYERNAKPAKSDMLRIRQALLGRRGIPSDYSDSPKPPHFAETMARLEAILAEKSDPKSIPPADAPAYTDNRDDPYLAFARAVHYVDMIASALDPGAHSETFYELMGNIRESSWQAFNDSTPENPHTAKEAVNRLMKETVRNIVYPALMRGLDEPTRQELDEQDAMNITNWSMYGSLAFAIAKGRSPHQVTALGESYRQQETALLDKLQSYIPDLAWEPLLRTDGAKIDAPRHITDGLQIVNLTNADQLREEGERLDLPLAGFISRCMEGTAHVFSIRDATGCPVGALALEPYYHPKEDGIRYRLLEHKAIGGFTPSPEAMRFAGWFIASQFTDGVPFDEKHHAMGTTTNAGKQLRPGLEKHSYHLISDMTPRRHQDIFDILCGKEKGVPVITDGNGGYLFPEHLRQLEIEDFLEQTGVNQNISKAGSHFSLHSYHAPQKPASRLNWEERLQKKFAHPPHSPGR